MPEEMEEGVINEKKMEGENRRCLGEDNLRKVRRPENDSELQVGVKSFWSTVVEAVFLD